jgi:hypothetical protein
MSARDTINNTIFCWSAGCFQAFAMVTPLYLFGIRPVFELSRLLYEVLFLMIRGSAEHFLGIYMFDLNIPPPNWGSLYLGIARYEFHFA